MNLTAGRRVLGTLLLITLLSAGGSVAHSSAAQRDELWGRTFLSTAVTENGQRRPLAEGTRVRITFAADRHALMAHAGCNHLRGAARLEGDRLIVGPLASTRIGCPQDKARQDAWLADLLESRPTWRLTGHKLTLVRGTTRLTLTDR